MNTPEQGHPGDEARSRGDWTFGAKVSLTCILALILLFLVVGTAALVRHAATGGARMSPTLSKAVLGLATWPGRTRAAVRELMDAARGNPRALVISRDGVEREYWKRQFPSPTDSGYLLLSGLDPEYRQSMVRLVRISDGETVAKWIPDWKAIYNRISDRPSVPRGNYRNARAVHPLLLPDGDIVFNTSNALVRLPVCSSQPRWVLDEIMHHSIEIDSNGSFLVSGVSTDGFPDSRSLRESVRDDSIARVSPDGRVTENLSIARILRSNGLEALLLGTHGSLDPDPIHANQIEEAASTTEYWRKGDLLVSLRHLSTVFLYRPEEGRVVWHRTGPWLNQHNAVFEGDRYIAVFDNHVINGVPGGFLQPEDHNRVVRVDLSTGVVDEPFRALLDMDRPATITEGRMRLLPDGGLFVEDSDNGRHLRYTRDRLLWSRINDFEEGQLGNLAWSRYLTAGEFDRVRSGLTKSCPEAGEGR